MSFNSFTLNTNIVNGPTVVVTLIGSGNLIEFKQLVGKIASGNLIEFEQDVQFFETGAGNLIEFEQDIQTTASGNLIEFQQIVVSSSPAASPSHFDRNGWDTFLTVGGVQIPRLSKLS